MERRDWIKEIDDADDIKELVSIYGAYDYFQGTISGRIGEVEAEIALLNDELNGLKKHCYENRVMISVKDKLTHKIGEKYLKQVLNDKDIK